MEKLLKYKTLYFSVFLIFLTICSPIIIDLIPSYFDLLGIEVDITSIKSYFYNITIHLFTDKSTLWNATAGLLTALAIATPLIWQIEKKSIENSDKKVRLIKSLLVELNTNFQTVFIDGFEIHLTQVVFKEISSNADMITDSNAFQSLSILYSYSSYFENIVKSKPDNYVLLSEKLTWLKINYISILRGIEKKDIEAHNIFNNVVGLKLDLKDQFNNKIDELKNKVSNSNDHKSKITELLENNEENQDLKQLKTIFYMAKDIVYDYLRQELSKNHTSEVSEEVTKEIYQIFNLKYEHQ